MIPETRKSRLGAWTSVAISAIAMILVAAAGSYDANLDRLRGMPAEERTRLLETLRRFDLNLTPEQQSAARELDRRLLEMPAEERAQYLSVLRRYHTWLNSLPENRQDELATRPPGDRMALVHTWIKERPAPAGETPPLLRVIEPGEYSPFEVASAYRIWQVLGQPERADLERKTQEHARRDELFRIGARAKHGIPRETRPADFDEDHWLGLLRAQWADGGIRPIAFLDAVAKSKANEAAKKREEMIRTQLQRRLAINLYVSKTDLGSVDLDRLARFIAALPPWIPASFEPLPPDEARRRMAFAYRLVFPKGEEIGAARKSAGSPPKAHAAPAPRAVAPPKVKRQPAQAGKDATPF